MQKNHCTPKRKPTLESDLAAIEGPFATYLLKQGFAVKTIGYHQRFLRRAANWLAVRNRSLKALNREEIPRVARASGCCGWRSWGHRGYRTALRRWLMFQGRYTFVARIYPWSHWLDDYEGFLRHHRGFADQSCANYRYHVQGFLKWRFRDKPAAWSQLRASDLRRYAYRRAVGRKPRSVNVELYTIEDFLRFLQMHERTAGNCAAVARLTMSTLSTRVQQYLRHKRRLGFALVTDGLALADFARFYEHVAPRQPLRIPLMLEWVTQSSTNRASHAHRFNAVRGFARFCASLDPRHQVPESGLIGSKRRLAPHIYTARQIRLILRRAGRLPVDRSPLRPVTCQTLFGLIASTGLRIREAVRLRRSDVDLTAGTMRVPRTKFSPERVLPLHPSTVRRLRRYAEVRFTQYPLAEAFFVGRTGRPLLTNDARIAFRQVTHGIVASGDHALPRIHDLRHTFATRHIAQWNREAAPVAHRLLLLSRYLGHQNFAYTWWYVSADNSALRAAAGRFERFYREESTHHVSR